MSNPKDAFRAAYQRFAAIVDDGGRMLLWALFSVLLLALIGGFINPAKFGSYLWVISKLSLAAVLGYGFDRAASWDSRPNQLDGLERSMAQSRRALVMAAVIVAAGLMP